ncbi:MAG TPA: hypothetical protein EYM89_03290 [Candidatus Marinimicrobia bacterium]|nr:hypothetical protein [Candidatus Neomarinimicrobiota bacterium]
MIKKLLLCPIIVLLLSTQACYTQLALFHTPEPEEQSMYGENDPYGLSAIERSSDFEPYLGSTYNGRRYYGYDPTFWSNYGYYGSPFSLYSPYNSYYGMTNQPYYNSGYGYGLTTPVIVSENNVEERRNWDRRGNESSSRSNLIIRREPPLAAVTAKPIRKEPPIPQRMNYQRWWDVSNTDYSRPSYRGTMSSSRSGGSNSSGGRSFSSGSSSSSSGTSSSSSSSGGRVTRRR